MKTPWSKPRFVSVADSIPAADSRAPMRLAHDYDESDAAPGPSSARLHSRFTTRPHRVTGPRFYCGPVVEARESKAMKTGFLGRYE